jgi:hypothetical protein
METYIAFSMTAALLLLWYMAGLLTEPGHRKLLDFIAYIALFGGSPILVWIAARSIDRASGGNPERMRCAVAAPELLVLALLGLVWLPSVALSRIWSLPAGLHALILAAVTSRSAFPSGI